MAGKGAAPASIKFLGSIETSSHRKSQHDWQTIIATPWETRKMVAPLQDFIERWAVVVVFPVQSVEQAKALLDREEDAPALPETENDLSIECTRDQLADDFSLTPVHINVLEKQGIIVKIERGRYDYRRSVKGYIEELRRQARGKGDSNYQEERAKKLAIQREESELNLLERKKQLVSRDAVKRAYADIALNIKNKLLSASSRASNIEAQEIIDECVRECLADLAGIDGDKIADTGSMRTVRPSAAVNGKSVGRGRKVSKPKNKRRAR